MCSVHIYAGIICVRLCLCADSSAKAVRKKHENDAMKRIIHVMVVISMQSLVTGTNAVVLIIHNMIDNDSLA